jgi:hypothetical protein
MPILENGTLVEQAKMEINLLSIVPSSSTPARVSLKLYERATVFISVLNATTVTGSAITLKQAKDIANADSSEKALGFSTVYQDIDVAAGEGLTATAVVSNTFTTDATNSKQLLYVIEVTPDMFDITNGFDCFRVGTGNATAATVSVHTLLWPTKYGAGDKTSHLAPNAEVN